MIDGYILGICLRRRCHVFLKVLPNFASKLESRNFLGLLRYLEEKILSCRTYLCVRVVIEALIIRKEKKQQELTQWCDRSTY